MKVDSTPELVETICGFLPEFRSEWVLDCGYSNPASASLHAVYGSLLPYVGSRELTTEQIENLAKLLNAAVLAGGNSENAVSTCFLEGVGRELGKRLRPHLFTATRRRLRA